MMDSGVWGDNSGNRSDYISEEDQGPLKPTEKFGNTAVPESGPALLPPLMDPEGDAVTLSPLPIATPPPNRNLSTEDSAQHATLVEDLTTFEEDIVAMEEGPAPSSFVPLCVRPTK